ncbi:hypothetical protein [Streptomyces shenzhenensis]|uniref:hypothetical protein n=1 Tax=Streptomyces shenzhenensis TaxID=943815 RepID=UPI001F31C418|nr:hypothetical protein [Streptomyces shenzhenensis]
MKYKDEDEIKRALGIDSWRHLSKDKMVRFVAMMPDMGTEVALKIVEQFPAFKEFAQNVVDAIKKSHESTLSANKESQEHVHRAYQDLRETLKRELDKDDLTWEQKRELIEKMQEAVREESQKDSENKNFLDGALKKVMLVGGAALALGVAFVGGRVMAESKDDPEGTLEA